ncbi:MAG: TonB-linked SusC/RagA family outer membrane protein, partial [Nonlabens sp.]
MKIKFRSYLKGQKIITALLFSLLFLSSLNLFAQATGKVTDAETGEELIGVNILVSGPNQIGAVSDISGNYTISAQKGDSLVFSYTGYSTQYFLLSDNKQVDIAMKVASELMDAVVVIGYGSVRKEDLTGVVSKIDVKKFNKGVNSSPENLLTGKVAGLQISSNGEPGGANRIRLRGGAGLDAGNSPLIVIDGVPVDNRGNASGRNPLNFINTADVESITVLKDASAAAIYGSRGANGVIIITTKSGQSGKLKISYNGNASISTFSGRPAMLSTANFRNAISAKAPQEFEFLGETDTDWVNEITDRATSTEHNLSLSGGTKSFRYLFSGGFQNNDGILKTSANRNTSIAANLTGKLLNDKLTISLKSKTGFSKDQFAPNVMGTALGFDPTRPVLDPDSEYGGYFQWDDALAANNPVSTLLSTDEHGTSTRSLNNLTLNYELPFLEGLSIKSSLSYDYTKGEKQIFRDPLLKDGGNFTSGGFLFNEELRNYSSLIETFGTYKRKSNRLATSMTVTLGHSWQDVDRENRWIQGDTLKQTDNIWNYTTNIKQDSSLLHNRLISFFGRAIFVTKDRYLLTLSLRRDGSSRFGDANKWGLFPAAAFGWRIMEEPFADGWDDKLSNLKLRVSWGITGNEGIPDYLFTTFYSYGTGDAAYQFGDEFVNTLRGIGVDPSIKWEETSSTNVGLDFGFADNRLSGAIDVYRKYTNDLLFRVAAGAFTNISDRIVTNIGEMENRGVELELNGVILDRTNWGWNLNFNTSYNKNEITKLDNSNSPDFPGYETGGISGDVGQTIRVLKVGESVESFRTYRHIMQNGKPLPDNQDHNSDGVSDLLDIYEDINSDGIINENDLVITEKASPDFIFGLTSTTRYKKFDLAATFRASVGNYIYNNVASSTGYYQRLDDRVTNNIHESAFVNDFTERQLKSDIYI